MSLLGRDGVLERPVASKGSDISEVIGSLAGRNL